MNNKAHATNKSTFIGYWVSFFLNSWFFFYFNICDSSPSEQFGERYKTSCKPQDLNHNLRFKNVL